MMTNLLPGKRVRSKRSFKNIVALAIFIVSCICYQPAVAQNALDKLGLDNGTPATGAYSMRLLGAAYTGPLLRVDINGAYYDIYPDASAAGMLSLSSAVSAAYVNYNDAKTGATANTFGTILGSNNAFVAIWYDQSGSGNDELQSDPTYQPYVAVSGQLTTSNGLPAMIFQGRFLRAVLPSLDPVTPHTLIGVASAALGNIVALSSTTGSFQNSCLGSSRGGQSAAWFGGYFEDSFFETGTNTAALSIRSKTYTSADSTIRGYFNGSYVYAINPAIALNAINYNPYNLTTPDILIGYQCSAVSGTQVFGEFEALNGSASEVLVFTTALNTTTRQAVESSEATYYGVSYTADAPAGPTTASPLTLDKAGLGSGVQATGAYSVRRLSSGYTGPLARIALPNNFGFPPTYYDVYPDAATGAIASSSPIAKGTSAPDAAAHVSTGGTLNDLMQTGATYRVEQWYDQSGNGNNVLNYTLSRQPILINSGALVTNPGGSPAFSFGGYLQGRLPLLNPATAHTLNGVAAGTTGDIITLSSTHATGQNSAVGISNTFNTAGAYGGWGQAGFSTGPATSAAGIRSKVYSPGSINGYFNGANIFVNNTVTYNLTTPDILIGAETSLSQFLNGTLSEAFAFTSALSDADLRSLEKNQASYYKIPYHRQNTVSKLLDSLTTAGSVPATGAYALRLLNKNYTGPLLRVNINNIYYDVYPDTTAAQKLSINSPISQGYANYNDPQATIATSFLSTVLGSNMATVAIWYDQSGSGNDAMQSDQSQQPVIALFGVINTSSGLPSMQFNGGYLRAVLPSLNPLTPHTLNSVAAATTGAIVSLSSTMANYQNSSLGAGWSAAGGAWFGGWGQNNQYATDSSTPALSIRSKTYADTVNRGYFNGKYVFSMSPATGGINAFPYNLTTPDIVIGLQNNGSALPLTGSASEILVFTSVLNTADRQAVERNQSAYYSTAYTVDAPPAPAVINPVTLDKLGLGSSITATGAYALRRLSSAYTGPLARIAQATTAAPVYYDVYPDASAAGAFSLSSPVYQAGSALDAGVHLSTGATLNDIIAGGNFTVALWYDQSGNNNNVFNGTSFWQPTIINSGAIITSSNGFPAMTFQGRFLRAVLPSINPGTPHTLIGVASATTGNIVALSSTAAGYQNSCLGSSRGGQSAAWFGGYFEDSYYETGTNTAALSIRSKTYTNADSTIRGYFNGSYVYAINRAIAFNTITYNPYNLTTPDILIGYQCTAISSGQLFGEFEPLNGSASEVLVFTTALNTTARQAVESNEATYYGVSYTADGPPTPTTGSPLTLDKAGLGSGVQATGAYSVRQLSSAYTGPLARIALSNNFGFAPSYYDVYPDAGTGAIASSSPIATVGSAPDAAAHVSTGGTLNDLVQTGATYRVEQWYDQSGNGNQVFNYTQFSQPILINSSTLVTNPGGSPAFSFSGARLQGRLPSLNPATAHTLNGVVAGYTGDIITLSSTQATGQNSAVGISNSTNNAGAYGGWGELGFDAGPATTAAGIRSKVYSPGSINGYFNGANVFVNNTVTYNLTTPDILIGAETSISQFLNGTLSEAFAFTSALSNADLRSLEKNQAQFYNILYTTKADTLILAGATNPTNAADINYSLTFEDTVTGLAAGNFSLSASGAITSASIGTPATADGGLNWTIPVHTGTGDGTLALSLSNTQNLSMGLSNSLPLAADTVTIDKTAPTVTISAPSLTAIGTGGPGTVSYTVTYADANFNTSNLTTSGITLNNPTGTAIGTVTVTGSGTGYTVTISNISGAGTLGISLAGGYASDLAGNTDAGAGPSATFNVLSANASLSNLTLTTGFIKHPTTFVSTTYNYASFVGNGITSNSVTPTTTDPNATLTVNGAPATSGSAFVLNNLVEGQNLITIVVTAQDGATQLTYTDTLYRALSPNANLLKLTTNKGVLTPGFSNTILSYTKAVPNTVSSITFTPTTVDANATVTVGGSTTPSGTASVPQALNVGDNVINVVVTAANGSTKTYAVTVTRAKSSNDNLFAITSNHGGLTRTAPAATTFTKSLNYGFTSITLTPTTADPNASVTVAGHPTLSGTASVALPLGVGDNPIDIVVTAQDGSTHQTFTVTVTRAAAPLSTVYQPVAVANPAYSIQFAGDGIKVHEGLSPNGDGVNDFLMIDGIANHPDNKLQIMNRSGQLIFEAKNYDNSSKVFDGHSNKTGQMQLPGTYFYSLDYTDKGEIKHKTGFIILKY